MPFDGGRLSETAAHLLRAKRCIEERGWAKGVYRDGGRRCGVAAVWDTALRGQFSFPALRMLRAVLPDGFGHVEPWQDAPGRTIEEVYAAFDRAIALAMEEEGDGCG